MASKKVIISENMLKRLILSETIAKADIEEILSSKEFDKKMKDAIKSNKDIESEIKKIIAQSLTEVLKILWQRNNFWKDLIK